MCSCQLPPVTLWIHVWTKTYHFHRKSIAFINSTWSIALHHPPSPHDLTDGRNNLFPYPTQLISSRRLYATTTLSTHMRLYAKEPKPNVKKQYLISVFFDFQFGSKQHNCQEQKPKENSIKSTVGLADLHQVLEKIL